jgi:hypothetical protein
MSATGIYLQPTTWPQVEAAIGSSLRRVCFSARYFSWALRFVILGLVFTSPTLGSNRLDTMQPTGIGCRPECP